jgi:hypothetical protein
MAHALGPNPLASFARVDVAQPPPSRTACSSLNTIGAREHVARPPPEPGPRRITFHTSGVRENANTRATRRRVGLVAQRPSDLGAGLIAPTNGPCARAPTRSPLSRALTSRSGRVRSPCFSVAMRQVPAESLGEIRTVVNAHKL